MLAFRSAITDDDGPNLGSGVEAWLAPENFDSASPSTRLFRVSAPMTRRDECREAPESARELWAAVDAYIGAHLIAEDPVLNAVLSASVSAGLVGGPVSAGQGRFLELLVRITQSRRVLEIGTLGGYSTIWLARGMSSDGRVVTLELDAHHAEIASANIASAGLAESVEVRVGSALASMQELAAEGSGPFDLIFIDADKQNNPSYLEWALKLSRAGTVIVADNVVRAGRILDPDETDAPLGEGGLEGLRCFYERLGAEPRVRATVIQTLGPTGRSDPPCPTAIPQRCDCTTPAKQSCASTKRSSP